MAHKIAVSDTGPIIHLYEINEERCLAIFNRLYLSNNVAEEIERHEPKTSQWLRRKSFVIIKLNEREKRFAEYIALRFGIGLTDASVISIAKGGKIKTVLTDDLDVRVAAKYNDLVPVGSIGILLRAYRERVINKKATLTSLDNLFSKSSLYITPSLIKKAKDAVQKFVR